jgi:outer membrane receptor for ferrienterochelin and colicins
MRYIAILFIIFLALPIFSQTKTYTTKVSGACGMCQDRIQTAALNTIGVISAKWDASSQLLTITHEVGLFDEMELHQNVAGQGHDTEKIKADDKIYSGLPLCCLYREDNTPEKLLTHDQLNFVQGLVYALDDKKIKTAISGVSIQWKGTTVGTYSKANGSFKLERTKGANTIIISYAGYDEQEVAVTGNDAIAIVLRQNETIEEITVKARRKSMEISFINPIKMRKISQRELTKAACCNLSESFETNPAVDVSYTDAVTGTKQIEMLGLAGPYVQITRANMPDIRGLASIYGLSYIPGPWVKSMQLNLGTGSVINGFESIAGQINVELIKPNDPEKLSLNGYYGSGGRIEGNAIYNGAINDNLDANVMLHYNIRKEAHDNNFDGFLDMPKGQGYTLSNNYKWYGKEGHEAEFGIKVTSQDNTSGQDPTHHEIQHSNGYKLWKASQKSNRYEAYVKRGRSWLDESNRSIGFQLGGIYYDLQSTFGSRPYEGNQSMLYANLIYVTNLGNKDNKLSVGSSFQAEKSSETFANKIYDRTEIVPGVFGEYTYEKNEKFTLVFGGRIDHHNNYGWFATPRFHGRYALNQYTVVRVSIGRGQRTANIFAENMGAMASNRTFIVDSKNTTNPYGLNAEVAWNYGLNLTKDFGTDWQWSVDAYYTAFQNQIVVDFDKNPQQLNFYNLDGKSFSKSIQTQVDYTGLNGIELRLAYRYNDVKTQYQSGLRAKPLIAPHRAFANVAYELKKYGLKADYTINWQSTKRIADTQSNPKEYQLDNRSKAFFTSNAQLTKTFGSKYEIYFGGENIFSFIQPNAILDSGNPFGNYFDASMIWGHVFGAMWHGGFRYRIDRDN